MHTTLINRSLSLLIPKISAVADNSDTINKIVDKTDSQIALLIIAILAIMVPSIIIILKVVTKHIKERDEREIKRDAEAHRNESEARVQLMEVISRNTSALVAITGKLESNNKALEDICKHSDDMAESIDSMIDKTDQLIDTSTQQNSKIMSSIESILYKNDQILEIVNQIDNTSNQVLMILNNHSDDKK